jgi:hypothetical protein
MLVIVLNGTTKPFHHGDTEARRADRDIRPLALSFLSLCLYVLPEAGELCGLPACGGFNPGCARLVFPAQSGKTPAPPCR